MHGVTTAIVAFIFVCIVFPSIVRNRPQFYSAMAAVVLIVLLDAVAMIASGAGAQRTSFTIFAYSISALLQVFAIILLFLSAGGLNVRQLAGDMKHAYEVIRRGEEEKEIIIPIHGEMSAKQAALRRARADKEDEEEGRVVYNIDTEGSPAAPKPADPAKGTTGGPIPLE